MFPNNEILKCFPFATKTSNKMLPVNRRLFSVSGWWIRCKHMQTMSV